MKPRDWLILIVVLLLLLRLTLFSVDETQIVIVTQFGKPVRTIEHAGLKAKWPFQTRITLDKRLQLYDPPGSEFLTEAPEKKNLLVDTYVCWRIAPGQALRFLQTCGDRTAAEMRLHDIVWAELSAAVGHAQFAALVSTDAEELQAEEMMASVLGNCRLRAQNDYGIEVVDVAIKRLNFPEENKQSVFDRMRAERQRIAKQYRAEGEREAIKIRAEADKERTRLLAEAYRQAEEIKGRADATATAVYAAAHQRDPDFYEFTRTLDAYKKFLGKETTVVLSSDSELLDLLTEGQR
ncbi:MAG: protease modulator HflC [Armatimonadota bacterium]